MTILAIETSSAFGSVALTENGQILLSESCSAERGHSAKLFEVLERMLAVRPKCDRIVVGLGPGSYSGVRVAIAGAMGLRFGLQAELVGIPSVCAIADGEYYAVQDARRESFAVARVQEGECVEPPRLVTRDELAQLPVGIPWYAPEPLAGFDHVEVRFPSAERLAKLAAAGRSIVSRGNLEPLYLRDPHISVAKAVPGFGGR